MRTKSDEHPAVCAYTFLQPLRKVVRRTPNPAGATYYDEALECGHTILKQRGHKRKDQDAHYLPDHRRCPFCEPDPPPLLGVEVVLDQRVPYTPGDGRRIGFQFLNEAGRVSLTRTNKVRMHPDYHAQLPPGVFRRRRMVHGMWEMEWVCEKCGARGNNPGGRATHYRVKHGEGG